MSSDSNPLRSAKMSLLPLVGLELDVLRLPREALESFEPSQVGTIVGTLVDACVPSLERLYPSLGALGLSKAPGILGDREGYPDFIHTSGIRLELKMLYLDPEGVNMKSPPTPREPSARITQKVTIKNVIPASDYLLILPYRLHALANNSAFFSPKIIDIGLFPMIECVRARDHRLRQGGGIWFGDYETPAILSRAGKEKVDQGRVPSLEYGRKESEGKDYNEDPNFGKLKRIPYRPLQEFLRKHGCTYMASGSYPGDWRI